MKFVDDIPQKPRRVAGASLRVERQFAELQSRPGQWAEMTRSVNSSGAYDFRKRWMARYGDLIEAEVRRDGGEYACYIRAVSR